MSPSERVEAVRLALEIIEKRRARTLTKEQAASLINALNLGCPISAEGES